MYSIILKNAEIIDGTGKKAFRGDLAVQDDKIAKIGDLKNANAKEVLDLSGKYLAPGFVDIQNHSDAYWAIFDTPRLDSLAAQGITTALIGNCGASLAPLLSRDALLAVRKWHDLAGSNLNWLTFEEYLNELSGRKFGLNIASLVGYSTLRRGLLKDQARPLKDSEQQIINAALIKSLEAGAFGLSSGLSYAHEAALSDVELLEMAKILKRYNALFSVHLRSEAAELNESLDQALDLVYKTSVNMKISHFKVRGKNNWHLLPQALDLVEEAYHKVGNVHFDLYPYDFVWQVLYTYLPRWAYEGGRNSMLHHLKDQVQRKKILAYLSDKGLDYSGIFIAGTTMPLNVIGKTLGEIAKRHNCSSEQILLDLIENGGSEVLVFERNLNQHDVQQLLVHPLSIISTDGGGFSLDRRGDLVHPRCFGTMPKFLAWALEHNFPIEQAVQKITAIPAAKIGLKKRGVLAPGNFADLAVFDPGVNSKAGPENPYQFPQGIEHVYVNGKAIVEKSNLTENLNGRILKRNAA